MQESLEKKSNEQVDTQQNKFLAFELGKEVFGIEIRHVSEIIGIQKIIDFPETPYYVKGIINLRGQIIPVIDLRLRLNKEPAEYTDLTCIIIIDFSDILAGLIVDHVEDVETIPEESIAPPPNLSTDFQSECIMGIGKLEKDIRILLNCQSLFNNEEISMRKTN